MTALKNQFSGVIILKVRRISNVTSRFFDEEFPFVQNKPVQFRLFSATVFGQAYSLK
jgi:hypothetical protein